MSTWSRTSATVGRGSPEAVQRTVSRKHRDGSGVLRKNSHMLDKRQALRRALLPVKKLFGIHFGGCSEATSMDQQYNLGHIVPKALTRRGAPGALDELAQDENHRSMHQACGSRSALLAHEKSHLSCAYHRFPFIDARSCIFTRSKIGNGSPESTGRADARLIMDNHTNGRWHQHVGHFKDRSIFGRLKLGHTFASRLRDSSFNETRQINCRLC